MTNLMMHVGHAVLVSSSKQELLRREGYGNWIEYTRSVYKIVMEKGFQFGHLLDQK